MVKRSAALALVDMANAAVSAGELSVMSESIVPYLDTLLKDMQDSVRVCAAEALSGVISTWAADPNNAQACFDATKELVSNAMDDKSWRVRFAVVEGFDKIAIGYTFENAAFVEDILGQKLDDLESEVRLAAVKTVAAVGQALGGQHMNGVVIPALTELAKDSSGPVKTEVGKAMVGLILLSGVDLKALSAPILSFIQDGDKEDKIAVLVALKDKLQGEFHI